MRNYQNISLGVTHTTDQGSTIHSKGKEPVRAHSSKKGPEVVIAGTTTMRGQRRSTYRATGSGRVPPPFLPM
ncbi:hypothetical protein NC651_016500 [Populus alba x Populus x berolinensis]|nr:hypothetical protein NC651_016500 [Populus alba x Populus x berolinensis]